MGAGEEEGLDVERRCGVGKMGVVGLERDEYGEVMVVIVVDDVGARFELFGETVELEWVNGGCHEFG